MRLPPCLAVFAACALAGCEPSTPDHPDAGPADIVVLDGSVLTQNIAEPDASAVAIKSGRIAFVGDSGAVRKWIGPKTRVLKLNGETVLPGLIDTHIHVMESALSLEDCSFSDAALTVTQAAPIMLECVQRSPGDGWVVIQSLNAAGFHATRQELDRIVAKRPLFLWSADGHVGWANSAALKVAGITRKTADPRDGRIERDGTGEPTGFLVDGALAYISEKIPDPSPEQREVALRKILPQLHATGLTGYLEANTDAQTVQSYVDLARKGALSAKVSIALQSDGEVSNEEFSRLKKLRELAESQRVLRAGLIKIFEDGVMEYPTQSAAMLEPYTDARGRPTRNEGRLDHELAPLSAFIERADQEGFGVHVHAIGDRAVRTTLDAFAAARARGSRRSYSIAHLQLIDPVDLPRFRELNVFASLQLLWAQPDNYSVDALLPYIGAEREGRIYPARSLVSAGATIVGGSDWSVSSFNPFEAMATAISRTNPKEPQRGVLDIREALKLHEMLAAYTIDAARMLDRQGEIGSLEPGKAADLIVLDRRLDDASPAETVRGTQVTYAFTDGHLVIEPPQSKRL